MELMYSMAQRWPRLGRGARGPGTSGYGACGAWGTNEHPKRHQEGGAPHWFLGWGRRRTDRGAALAAGDALALFKQVNVRHGLLGSALRGPLRRRSGQALRHRAGQARRQRAGPTFPFSGTLR